jgi:hypothetical protein
MLNRQTIVEKVSNSADRYGASNPQQLNQLLRSLANASDNELFFGLFSFFYDPALQSSFERQQLAGTLLYELCPACPLELDGAIYAIPALWNLSVEEVPWYFCKVFGKSAVENFLVELIPEVEGGSLKKSFETLSYWVKRYKPKST